MSVDRRQFTPLHDNPPISVPIGLNQVVPTEHMVYLLADLCNTCGRVLEIGTGSGYQAAVLAERCNEVVSVEVQPIANVAENSPDNVTLVIADGCTFDTGEEFDAVLITFAAPEIFPAWKRQVKEGGRLVIPLHVGMCCSIRAYIKVNGELELVDVAGFAAFSAMVRGQHEDRG